MSAATRLRLLLAILGMALLAGCFRYQEIWSGAEFDRRGNLRVAADEPFCGCLDLANRSSGPIELRARVHNIVRGSVILQSGQSLRAKFDWAGPDATDVFVLEAFSVGKNAKRLRTSSVVHVNSYTWPFYQCDEIKCDWSPLQMNTGTMKIRE